MPSKFFTQAQLAEFFNVTPSAVAKWARQRHFPKRSTQGYYFPAVWRWVLCFGPQRSEANRDEILLDQIAQLLRQAEKEGDDE